MKREELRDLGLSDEQVSKVMGMHSAELNDVRANLQDATSERDQLKKLLEDNDNELTKLRDSAKDNETLQKQLDDLQGKFDQSKQDSENTIKTLKLNNAVDLSIAKSHARNAKAVKALIDMDKVKMTDDGLSGLDDQISSLQESDSYLFEEQHNDTSNSTHKGNPSGGNGEGTDDRAAFKAALGLKD